MIEDREQDQTPEESSEAAAEGPGNVTVDEPTETSLDASDDEDAFEGGDEEGSKDS